MFLADKHNFGQQVEKVQRGSDIWYRKPRSVYWEWFFFGKTSPLKNLFDEVGSHGAKTLSEYFFNLDIEIESTWCGYAREYPSEEVSISNEHFYAYGALIAYCYIFGIRDLHKQNLIKTKTHFQVVDVEVVFTSLILPNETLLLPFKSIGYEFAGIGALVNSQVELTKENKKQLILGYWDLFDLVIRKKQEIEEVLAKQDFSKIPSRMIIRNTSEYRNFLENLPDNALSSEIEQMRRGDIPYYFKFIGNKNLYWLSSLDTHRNESSVGIFQRDIDRHMKYENSHWCEDRITIKVLITGMLYLLKSLAVNFELNFSKDFQVKNNVIVFEQKKYEF